MLSFHEMRIEDGMEDAPVAQSSWCATNVWECILDVWDQKASVPERRQEPFLFPQFDLCRDDREAAWGEMQQDWKLDYIYIYHACVMCFSMLCTSPEAELLLRNATWVCMVPISFSEVRWIYGALKPPNTSHTKQVLSFSQPQITCANEVWHSRSNCAFKMLVNKC